ncbi:MAG: hypothetical protein KKD01_08275 [Proteobacteria bacterium]|nr:hypothetical protein [Pseudomonadota bacterium]MBU1416880.1 hypothetical protein [Pseudomonadota bacterium]MBU1454710.1 hypothetical protein [Pseudomonadota bacterium]
MIQLYGDYRYGLDSIEKSVTQIEVSYLDGIINSLWLSDTELLQIQLEGILKLPDMQYVDVVYENGMVAKAGEIQAAHVVKKEFLLSYTYGNKTIPLGRLHIVYTLENIYDRLTQKAIVIIVSQGVKTFMVSGFIFFVFYMLVARHLQALASYANALDLHTLEKPFVLKRKQHNRIKDEFDILVKAINEMRMTLQASYRQLQGEIIERKQVEASLRKSESRYRGLFEEAPISLWEEDFSAVRKYIDQLRSAGITDFRSYFISHPESVDTCAQLIKIIDVNRETLKILGAGSKELLYGNLDTVFGQKSYEAFREELICLAEGKYNFELQTVNKTLQGNEIQVILGLTVVPGYEDTWSKVFVSLSDVTQRMQAEAELSQYRNQLEELVQKRTEELQEQTGKVEKSIDELQKVNSEYDAANKELKEFAYVVSHDLKAPLRAISQLTHWLSEDYSAGFDAEGKEQMQLILQRVKRMDGLIDGILRYSRIGRIKEKEKRLDLNLLVEEVIDSIAPRDTIQILFENKLPVVFKNAIRMEQVFQNLLGNAIKYMDKDEGIIKVGCVDEGAFWKFSVSDNGPGIDKKYHEKIFQIFQTLMPRDEHESTGIGLTLVKKIVALYGGSVWVESESGKGAAFFFTLPKKGEKDEKL